MFHGLLSYLGQTQFVTKAELEAKLEDMMAKRPRLLGETASSWFMLADG